MKNVVRILGLILLVTLILPTVNSITQINADINDNNITSETSVMPTTENTMEKSFENGPVKDKIINNNEQVPRRRAIEGEGHFIPEMEHITDNSASKQLPASIMTLVNGSTDSGDIGQNEFIVYDFEVTDVNGSAITVYANWTVADDEFLDVMIDDAAGNTLGGEWGGMASNVLFEGDFAVGTYYVILFGADTGANLDYDLEFYMDEIVETGPDGLSFANAYPVEVNNTYDLVHPGNSTYYNAYGHPGWGQYFGDNDFYCTFDVPDGMKWDVNMTITFDNTTTDLDLWYSSSEYGFSTVIAPYIYLFDDGVAWTSDAVETIFAGGLGPGTYTIGIVQYMTDVEANFTLHLNAVPTQPYPLDQAFDVAIGDEITFDNDTMLPYNFTLVNGTEYIIWIGEPDNWFVDVYGEVPWPGNFDGDLYLEIYDPAGNLVDEEDDSHGEWAAWLSPWYSRFTPTADGEYTFWFGPADGVSPAVGSLQVVTADWCNTNAPGLSTATGSWNWNTTDIELVNMVDIYNINVNSSVAGDLHVVYVDDTYGDAAYYQGMIIYDENMTLITDSGFRTATNYGEAYCNPSVAGVLDEGDYTVVVQAWFSLDAEINESYTIHHDIYPVEAVLTAGANEALVMNSGTPLYYVIEPSTTTRWSYFTVECDPGINIDVSVELWDLDMQFAREIADNGGLNYTETINYMADTIDLAHDASGYGRRVVKVETSNVTGTGTLNFNDWAPSDLTTASGTLDPDVQPSAFYRANIAAGDYVVNFTAWNTTSTWNPDDVFLVVGPAAGGSAVFWCNSTGIEMLSLEEGVYYFWIMTGDRSLVPTHNYLKNGPYGRCGHAANLAAGYAIEFYEFSAPAAVALDVYEDGYVETEIDAAFDVVLESGVSYYFWWDQDYYYGDDYDFDAVLYDTQGNVAMSEDLSFIYTPLFAGTYTLWLHEFTFNVTGTTEVTVRPIEVVDTHSPDHIVSQWYYDYSTMVEQDYWYVIEVVGNSYTYMWAPSWYHRSYFDGIFVDMPTDQYTPDLNFMAACYFSYYAFDYAGMWTTTLYKVPHLIETVTETTTEAAITVTDTVTEPGTNFTDTITEPGLATTVTETESPGFELLIFLLAIPVLFVIQRRRR